jgi:hypothetical protein
MRFATFSLLGFSPGVLLLASAAVGAALLLTVALMPDKVLRVLLQIYPKGHPRRVELEAEFFAMRRREQVAWLAELVEVVLFDGIPARMHARTQVVPRTRKGSRTTQHISATCAMVIIAFGTLIDAHSRPWSLGSGHSQQGSSAIDGRFNPDFEDQPKISGGVVPNTPQETTPDTSQQMTPNTLQPPTIPNTPQPTIPNAPESGPPTDDERRMLELMDPNDRARYLLQKRIQEKSEMSILLSQLQSLRHQTSISVINNIR